MNTATFKELSPSEQQWIGEQLGSGRRFVACQAPQYATHELTLEILDAAWTAWLATSPTDVDEINRAINSIGIPFGAILVGSGFFEWCIATDDYGTDLAVRALPNRGDVLIYPTNFVSKRWEKKVTGFLVGAYPQIIEQVTTLRKEWDEACARLNP